MEKYQNRLTRANNQYKARTGRQLTESKKMMTAAILENTASFLNFKARQLNEALDNSIGTQSTDVASVKKFVLDITEASLPNLIAPELCKVVDLPNRTGFLVYRKYTANSRKGVRNSNDGFDGRMNLGYGAINNAGANTPAGSHPFGPYKDTLFGTLENGRPQSEYTSRVVEQEATFGSSGEVILAWTPVLRGSVFVKAGTTCYVDAGNGTLSSYAGVASVAKKVVGNRIIRVLLDSNGDEVTSSTPNAGTILYGTTRDDHFDANGVVSANLPKIHGSITISGATGKCEIEYQYENDYVPQNDIPLIGVSDETITLSAKPRRIAIYFSQLAAFEAQKDYNRDLGAELREKASFEIQAEIDNEVVENIIACGDANATSVTWYAKPGVGVNMRDHFETLAVTLADADAEMYLATNKYSGNFVLVGPKGLRFFSMMAGFKALNANRFGFGPYVAGELNGHKIIVTPIIREYDMYVGVNTADAFAVLLGIYMAVAPTQLVEFADGGNSQGFSTLYDLVIVNPQLVVKIVVEDSAAPATIEVVDGE